MSPPSVFRFPLPVPVEVMRPVAVSAVPGLGERAASWQHSIKLDGWRTVALRYPDRLVLQSRAGTVITERFPEAAAALREALAPGTVLDGEICAFHPDGRLDFAALQRTPAHRAAAQIAVQFVAFDVLCTKGQDLRALPLSERWPALTTALDSSPLTPVLATSDRETALGWARDLAPLNVEGIVSRRWDSPYRPALKRAWVKHRSADTQDARILAVLGPPRRPRAVRILLEGRPRVTSPRLTTVQASEIARAVAGHLSPAQTDPDGQLVHEVLTDLIAEVRTTTGRHATTRFIRLRPNH
ncbi:RNA ligase family protein [Streptomyces sp. 21So2-11]|uniref:ATP-dependent DNA ligase n=1 Tax=Streptomyces sp. 21So2-11 TaxID=3144408 RepID=UPI00321A312D